MASEAYLKRSLWECKRDMGRRMYRKHPALNLLPTKKIKCQSQEPTVHITVKITRESKTLK
jgi:hypothetical protein